MKTLFSIVLAAGIAAAGTAHAAAPGDAEAGKQKSQTCAACHGPDGNSQNPIYPILAGQYRDYIAQALTEYRSGSRNNPIMRGFASALSDQDILDLALYFSRQDSKLATPKPD